MIFEYFDLNLLPHNIFLVYLYAACFFLISNPIPLFVDPNSRLTEARVHVARVNASEFKLGQTTYLLSAKRFILRAGKEEIW